MKIIPILTLLFLATCFSHAQGVLIFDQQSTNTIEGGAPLNILGQPMGQSFTPTFSSISFVILNLYDADILHDTGATVFVNVRSNSITGLILGSSDSVFMPDQFFGTTNFVFSVPVNIVSGTTYYLQPIVQSGNGWGSYVTDGSYSGGSLIQSGNAIPGRNLWFQEGVIVTPEPSSEALVLLGGFAGLLLRCRRLK